MPELRFNLVTKDWVIMAPERAKRPEDFIKKNVERGQLPAFKESCPFCPGHENLTPPETYRLGTVDSWQVRSIPNKFSALSREGDLSRRMDGIKRTMAGVGLHDVIIENPLHTWIFPRRHLASFDALTEAELLDMASALQQALQRLYYGLDDPDYNYVLRSLPDPQGNIEYFHFYLAIVPRLTKAAGFELGSGMYINTQLPEKDAELLYNSNQSKPD